ncbi:unnamed protein product, partial [Ectocarpus sp. 12 AP-2014]
SRCFSRRPGFSHDGSGSRYGTSRFRVAKLPAPGRNDGCGWTWRPFRRGRSRRWWPCRKRTAMRWEHQRRHRRAQGPNLLRAG